MKKAYNHILLPNGELTGLAVVEFGAQGAPLAWHTLEGEEPQVEWVGGTYDMKQLKNIML